MSKRIDDLCNRIDHNNVDGANKAAQQANINERHEGQIGSIGSCIAMMLDAFRIVLDHMVDAPDAAEASKRIREYQRSLKL